MDSRHIYIVDLQAGFKFIDGFFVEPVLHELDGDVVMAFDIPDPVFRSEAE